MKPAQPLGQLESPVDELINVAQGRINARTRTELYSIIGMAPPVVSKIRRGKVPVSAEMLLRLHDATGLPVNKIREVLKLESYFDLDSYKNAQQSGAQQTAQSQGNN